MGHIRYPTLTRNLKFVPMSRPLLLVVRIRDMWNYVYLLSTAMFEGPTAPSLNASLLSRLAITILISPSWNSIYRNSNYSPTHCP